MECAIIGNIKYNPSWLAAISRDPELINIWYGLPNRLATNSRGEAINMSSGDLVDKNCIQDVFIIMEWCLMTSIAVTHPGGVGRAHQASPYPIMSLLGGGLSELGIRLFRYKT